MYKQNKMTNKYIKVNNSYAGETIEKKVARITQNKEPIKDGAPLVYTERKDGVRPETDIRTDRWEVAIDAMDKVTAAKLAQREERHKTKEGTEDTGKQASDGMNKENGGPESVQTT